jgi:hypothetical protein
MEAFLAASEEVDVDVSVQKTKYTFWSHEQNAGQYHNMKIGNKVSESVEQVKC